MEINATNRLLGGREGAKPGANESSSRKEPNLHGLMERNSQAPRRRSGVAQACAPRLCALVGEMLQGSPRASVRTQITESDGSPHEIMEA